MKILFVIDNYYPFRGGAETLFKNLAEGLVAKGYEVSVLTRQIKATGKYEELNGVKIHRVAAPSRYLFTLLAIPKAIMLARKADIIHTSTFNSAFPAWLASKLSKKPAVITIHEVWIGKWKEYTDMSRFNAKLHSLLERPIYKLNFKKHICVSESTRNQLLAVRKKADAIVIYNGLDYEHFHPDKTGAAVRKELGIPRNAFVALTFGRAAPSKGIEYAAMAAQKVDIPNFKYLFIVSRDYSSRYKKVLPFIQSTAHAILLDPIAYSKLPNYVAAADVVVIPSLAEGFGYTAAESCAMGKIVIASNTTSLPEVVSGKFILVEPKNPQAIADAIKLAKEGKFEKSKLKKFTIQKNIDEHLKLYNHLVPK
jgi:D-inositol-3-phosphate glycosyltransferase